MIERPHANLVTKAQALLQTGNLMPHRVLLLSQTLREYREKQTADAYDALYNAVSAS